MGNTRTRFRRGIRGVAATLCWLTNRPKFPQVSSWFSPSQKLRALSNCANCHSVSEDPMDCPSSSVVLTRGIEEILQAASAIDPHMHFLGGGLHLVSTPEPEIDRLVDNLKNKGKIGKVPPG